MVPFRSIVKPKIIHKPFSVSDNELFYSWFVLLFFSSYVIFTSLYIYIFRFPLEIPRANVFFYYSIIGISSVFSCGVGARLTELDERRTNALRVALLMLAIATPLGITFLHVGTEMALLLVTLGCAVLPILAFRLPMPQKSAFPSIPAAAVFAGYCFLTVNSMDYATVLSPENALAGLLNKDTLYHTAIASMFTKFGVPSTGLDGVPLTHYYVLSHIWLGSIASNVGINAIYGYFLGNQIVFIPLMYLSIASATRSLVIKNTLSVHSVFTVILPINILLLIGIFDWNSYLVSESHAIGLVFVLFGLSFLVPMARNISINLSIRIFLIGCAIAFAAVATKISAGLVFISAFYYLLFRSRGVSYKYYAFLFLFSLFLLWTLYAFLAPSAHAEQSKVEMLDFFWSYPRVAIANLVPILVAASITVWRWRNGLDRPLQEVLIIMLVVSTAPALSLKIDGGSAYYFINIGTWISVAIIASSIIDSKIFSSIDFFYAKRLRIYIFLSMLLLIVINLVDHRAVSKFTASINRLKTAVEFSKNTYEAPGTSVRDNAKASALGRLVSTIERSGGEDHAEIVMIAPELWKAFPYKCPFSPLFVPAYTGRPLLLGLQQQAVNCSLGPYYSFPDYGLQSRPKANMTDEEACMLAKARGFAVLVRVETLDYARLVTCA